MWRREVFDSGLRFDPFFRDYGVLEDAHLSLRAGRSWELLQCGDARCEELHSPSGRVDRRSLAYKAVVNYYCVFKDIVQPLDWRCKTRFWSFQLFELFRIGASAIRRRRRSDVEEVLGRIAGFAALALGRVKGIGHNALPAQAFEQTVTSKLPVDRIGTREGSEETEPPEQGSSSLQCT
jgi:hypothetical protein